MTPSDGNPVRVEGARVAHSTRTVPGAGGAEATDVVSPPDRVSHCLFRSVVAGTVGERPIPGGCAGRRASRTPTGRQGTAARHARRGPTSGPGLRWRTARGTDR